MKLDEALDEALDVVAEALSKDVDYTNFTELLKERLIIKLAGL